MRTSRFHPLRLAGSTALVLAIALAAAVSAQGADPPQRIAFQISTGNTDGTYFPVGELLASLLSHPPGIGRCDAAPVCGPAGLIVSTRASEGSVANVLAVNSGMVNSGLAQADVVAMAVSGQGPFKKYGPAKQLRVIADLYGEEVHLVAAKNAKIKSVADLRGKRVSLSTEGSGTLTTARAILAAYGLSEKSLVANYDPTEKAAQLFQAGKLDALFFVGGAPVDLIGQLTDEGGRLIAIDGLPRERLLAKSPYLTAETIPNAAYGNGAAIETVGIDALWITDASQPDAVIYGMVKALYNPRNRTSIEDEKAGTHFLELGSAVNEMTAPLHPGAARYFTEAGVLKAPLPKTGPATPPRKS
jgi:TRAP transporter TAXI family solute receptor